MISILSAAPPACLLSRLKVVLYIRAFNQINLQIYNNNTSMCLRACVRTYTCMYAFVGPQINCMHVSSIHAYRLFEDQQFNTVVSLVEFISPLNYLNFILYVFFSHRLFVFSLALTHLSVCFLFLRSNSLIISDILNSVLLIVQVVVNSVR